jgi:hypothetical protein
VAVDHFGVRAHSVIDLASPCIPKLRLMPDLRRFAAFITSFAVAACSSAGSTPDPVAHAGSSSNSGGALASSGSASGGIANTGGATGTGRGAAGATGGAGGTVGTSVASGGIASGGIATGGVATGGVATGGVASGGAPAPTGGVGAGGIATGGASASGGQSALDLFVSPDGNANAAGTLEQPTTLAAALTRIGAGHAIFLRGGTYAFVAQVSIERDNSGTNTNPKQLFAYAGEHPKLDFSSEPYGTGSNPRGLQINGSYWYLRGLEILGAADNGIYVAGNNNVIENCVTHGNRDTGLQIGRASSSDGNSADWPSNNLILNCESYDNYDSPPGGGENADGFAAKLTVGVGNTFRGCVSHNNIDDGWDLYTKTDTGAIGPVTIDRCIAYSNGTLTDGTSNANGDRNGFKLGGDDIAVAHVVTRSVAFKNGKNGFTWNSNPGAIRLSNNLAFDNVEGNFKFGDNATTTAAVFTNNVSFWTSTASNQSDKAIGTDASNSNAWWDKSKSQPSVNAGGLVVSAADFANSLASPKLTRSADGSPNFDVFSLATDSDLVGAGVLPAGELPFDASGYYVGAPDLGAVEAR